MEEISKKKAFLIKALYAGLFLAIAIFLCRKALPVLLPLVVAWIVALIINPVVRFGHEKLHLPRGIVAVVMTVLVYAVVAIIVVLLGLKAVTFVRETVPKLPQYYAANIEPALYSIGDWMTDFAADFDPDTEVIVAGYLSQISGKIGAAVSEISLVAIKAVTGYAFSLPKMLVNTIIMVVGTVFLATDLTSLKNWILCQCTEEQHYLLHNVRVHLGKTLVSYIRSYGIILLMTATELFIALNLMKINNPGLIAASIALLDILPVVGCGTVLLPWMIISFVMGNIPRGLELLVAYLVITVIRNIVEPKLIGDRVGMHPIVTLFCMVAGSALFGPVGILGFPIFMALVVSLNHDGVIHIFRDPPQEAEAPKKKFRLPWHKKN